MIPTIGSVVVQVVALNGSNSSIEYAEPGSSHGDAGKQIADLEVAVLLMKRNARDFNLVVMALFTLAIQLGLTFMKMGQVRTKNTTNILLKSIIDSFLGCLCYWLIGYTIAWSDGNCFIGWNNFAFTGLEQDKMGLALYQLVFCNIASSILIGAVAERFNFALYLPCSVFLSGIALPFVIRWSWHPDGWLKGMGFQDFSGSGVIHFFSGTCALVGAYVLGPRSGRFSAKGSPESHAQMNGHSIPFVGIGLLTLTIGFMGFNASAGMTIHQSAVISTTPMVNTYLAGSSAAVVTLILQRFLPYWGCYWSFIAMAKGCVCGMVAVCAGADILAPWAAALTGVIAAAIFIISKALVEKSRIDDAIDAFAIHGGGGLVGLLTAPFLIADGILYSWDQKSAELLSCNISGAILIAAWAVLWILPLFALLGKMNVLRVPLEVEVGGLDIAKHNEEAYSAEAWHSFLMTYKQNRTPVECLNPLSQEAIPAPPPLPAPLIELQPVVQGFMQRKRAPFLQKSARSITETSLLPSRPSNPRIQDVDESNEADANNV